MPTYDYRCNACKHEFEHMQSMKDKPLKKCPECGKSALERLIGTGGAIIFKGGGFYQTDYRSDSYKKAAEADTKPASSDAASAPAAGKPADAGAAKAKPEGAPAKDAKADAKPAVPASKPTSGEGPTPKAPRKKS